MNTDLNTLKTNAYTAADEAGNIQTQAPQMLQQLKSNLVGIFSKDNPIMAERETALQDYMNSPSTTRASLLPSNMGMVEGSNLNLSPTQQNAITTARSNAALVPLAGLNNIIRNQYGSIGDIVQGAGASYDAAIRGSQTRAGNMLDLYKLALAEEESKRNAAGSSGFDLNEILKTIQDSQNQGNGNGQTQDLSGLDDVLFGGGQTSNAPSQQRQILDSVISKVNTPQVQNTILAGTGLLPLKMAYDAGGWLKQHWPFGGK
jgi:hypothetical protein